MPTYILIFSLPGIIASAVLFVLFYRNRKQDRMTRRRFLLPFILVLAHTLLYILVPLCKDEIVNILAPLWLMLFLIMLITVVLYWCLLSKWNNLELGGATVALTLYCALVLMTFLIPLDGIGC